MLKLLHDIDRDIYLSRGKEYRVVYSNEFLNIFYIEDDSGIKAGLDYLSAGYLYYFTGEKK